MFSSVCGDVGGIAAGSLLVELVTKCSLIHWKTVPIQTSSSSSSSGVLSLTQVSLQLGYIPKNFFSAWSLRMHVCYVAVV